MLFFYRYPPKNLTPAYVLGPELMQSTEVRRLENAGLVETITSMWMTCLLSPDVKQQEAVLAQLVDIDQYFSANIGSHCLVLGRVCAFLETRKDFKPDSQLAKICGDITSVDFKTTNEKDLFRIIEQGSTPINSSGDGQKIESIHVKPVLEVFQAFKSDYLNDPKQEQNNLERAFVACRPWIWSVSFGIADMCAQHMADTKWRFAYNYACSSAVNPVGAFFSHISNGAKILTASVVVFSPWLFGWLQSLLTGFGVSALLTSNKHVNKLYSNFIRHALMRLCARADAPKDTSVCELEIAFLKKMQGKSVKSLHPVDRFFLSLAQKFSEIRHLASYTVGVVGQPDVGKSEFLHSGCGFPTTPGSNEPTLRLMQYTDKSLVSWLDFPGVADVFAAPGTLLDFQVEADLTNLIVVIYKAGNRNKCEPLLDLLAKTKKPPILVCFNKMDQFVEELLENANSEPRFEYVCRKVDEFNTEMRKCYNFGTARTVYTCFRHPTVKDAILWNKLAQHYNILSAQELVDVIRKACPRTENVPSKEQADNSNASSQTNTKQL